MSDFNCILGSEKQGIRLQCEIVGRDVYVKEYTLLLYGCGQLISVTNSILENKIQQFAYKEYHRFQKYKRMEELMLKNLSESVVIENERVYEQCLWEYKQKLEGDERMSDLNGDLKAF